MTTITLTIGKLHNIDSDIFEDELDDLIRAKGIGNCIGAGTDIESGEVDVSFDVTNSKDSIKLIEEFLKMKGLHDKVKICKTEDKKIKYKTKVGQVFVVCAEGKSVVCKVLKRHQHFDQYGYIMVGIYGFLKDGKDAFPDVDGPISAICTYADCIELKVWRTIGITQLTEGELALFPGDGFDVVGISICPRKPAERRILAIAEKHGQKSK